ncbi:MAG TPA: 4-(cytidine 5'-diphospho)-2-C-methyl-D-erythritol kinase [Vicinamibacterales bacterium]|jgi:4-diphosphocytidyl-2-C-methyl-D-erythritol kinase
MSSFTYHAHAKVNLSLRVMGRRPDGFHELKTVFQSLALHDTLTFEPCEGPLTLDCRTPGIPLDSRNLIVRAAQLIWREGAGRGGEPDGVRVTLSKRVPAQGGLGGGSSDGAAALVAFDRWWGTHLPRTALFALGARLGADVPFFLCGGTALGLERGDEIYPLVDATARWVVLVFPPFGVSTPDAFRWFDEDNDARRDTGVALIDTAKDPRASLLPCGASLLACDQIVNDLEPPVTRRHPEIGHVRRLLELAGAEDTAMTGSGSTVFGLFTVKVDARGAADRLTAAGWSALVTRTATRRQARLLV